MDPIRFITWRTLQRGGIWRVPIPGKGFYVVAEPSVVKRILVDDPKCYDRSEVLTGPIAADLGDEGLLILPDGEQHQQLRRIMNPFFARPQMGSMAELIRELWEPYMTVIRQSKGPVKTYEIFSEFSVDFLMKYMFDKTVSKEDIARLSRLAAPVFEQMTLRLALYMVSPRLADLVSKARKNLDTEIWELIKRAEPGEDGLISRLKAATDPETGQTMTDKQIRDQVFTLLMAGFDSVAVVWAWILRHLAKHPKEFRDLQAEVQERLQDRPPTWEDVEQLEMLQETISRLTDRHMAFPIYYRGVKTEQWLGGQMIPAGATVIINLDAMHRILEAQGQLHVTGGRSPYIPYGAGRRQCIGMPMAKVMIAITLVRILQTFDSMDIPPGHSKDQAAYAMTRPPKNGGPMEFTAFE